MVRKSATSVESVAMYFHLPIQLASRKLGISQTLLKKICRNNGIERWPHRKVRHYLPHGLHPVLAPYKLNGLSQISGLTTAIHKLEDALGYSESAQCEQHSAIATRLNELRTLRAQLCFGSEVYK